MSNAIKEADTKAVPVRVNSATKETDTKTVVLRILFYLLVAVIIVFNLFPFVWALLSSFRPSSELFSTKLLPTQLTLAHYQAVFKDARFVAGLINSIIVAGCTVLIALGLGSLCAYALGRLPFRFKGPVLYLILTMTMFPTIAVLSGLFVMLKTLSLFNTRQGLIVTYLIFTMPFTIWVMTQYFRSLPRELEEAAYVDGASPLKVFWDILLPLTVPGLVSTGLLAFIAAWNEFLFALTFTVTDTMKTVPVVISQFSGSSSFEQPWGSIMAGSMVVTIPLVILVMIFQYRIVEGLTSGAVKG
ncbi:MAG TPA: carbohydrate ABC transporter permease [Chthoniobacterales bacterium]|jgi:trehalose/maltose transport system permease protein|nr:carbohydrate ABC transporter permease [Chthoniobacterales bacterium]